LGDSFPSISPDGRSLAFARLEEGYLARLYLLPLTQDLRPAGEPVRVTDRHYPMISGIAWTANGREVVYGAGSVGASKLWRVSVSGGQAPTRLPYATPDAAFPAIAARTSRLAYTWNLVNWYLWRLDTRTGERRMLIGSTYDSRIPQYSPDGRKIAFQSNRSGSIEVWTCDADGSNCLQLTSFGGPQCGTPRWSPDGRSIALDSRVEGRSEVYVIAADGGTPRRVSSATRGHNTRPSWSPDGRWIYFTSDRSGRQEIWKMPTGGGQAVRVTRSGGASPLSPPDGKYIYYVKEPGPAGLFRMPVEGGEEEQVLARVGGWWHFGVATTDVYFAADGRLQFLDAATGKVSTLTVVDNITGGLCVSPDGHYVVWAQRDRNTTDLMLVENFR
jgi:Tol biopolymer transport system component